MAHGWRLGVMAVALGLVLLGVALWPRAGADSAKDAMARLRFSQAPAGQVAVELHPIGVWVVLRRRG